MKYKKDLPAGCRHQKGDGSRCKFCERVGPPQTPSQAIAVLQEFSRGIEARRRLDAVADYVDEKWETILASEEGGRPARLVQAVELALHLYQRPLDKVCLDFIRQGRPIEELAFMTSLTEEPRKVA
jgi:hypothetical protein